VAVGCGPDCCGGRGRRGRHRLAGHVLGAQSLSYVVIRATVFLVELNDVFNRKLLRLPGWISFPISDGVFSVLAEVVGPIVHHRFVIVLGSERVPIVLGHLGEVSVLAVKNVPPVDLDVTVAIWPTLFVSEAKSVKHLMRDDVLRFTSVTDVDRLAAADSPYKGGATSESGSSVEFDEISFVGSNDESQTAFPLQVLDR